MFRAKFILSVLVILLIHQVALSQYTKAEFQNWACKTKWVLIASVSDEAKMIYKTSPFYYLFSQNGKVSIADSKSDSLELSRKWYYDNSDKNVHIKNLLFKSLNYEKDIVGDGIVTYCRKDLLVVNIEGYIKVFSPIEKEKIVSKELEDMFTNGEDKSRIRRFVEIPVQSDNLLKIEAFYPYHYAVASHYYDSLNHRIIFSTHNAGLLIYDLKNDSVEVINSAKMGITFRGLRSVRSDRNGDIWTFANGRLFKISRKNNQSSFFRLGCPHYPYDNHYLSNPTLFGFTNSNNIAISSLSLIQMDSFGILRPLSKDFKTLTTHVECRQPVIRNKDYILQIDGDSVNFSSINVHGNSYVFFNNNSKMFLSDGYLYEYKNKSWNSTYQDQDHQGPYNRFYQFGLIASDEAKRDFDVRSSHSNYAVVMEDRAVLVSEFYGIYAGNFLQHEEKVVCKYKFIELDEILGKKSLPVATLPIAGKNLDDELGKFSSRTFRAENGNEGTIFSNEKGLNIKGFIAGNDSLTITRDGKVSYLIFPENLSLYTQADVLEFDGENLWLASFYSSLIHYTVKNNKVVKKEVFKTSCAKEKTTVLILGIKQYKKKLLLFTEYGLAVVDLKDLEKFRIQ